MMSHGVASFGSDVHREVQGADGERGRGSARRCARPDRGDRRRGGEDGGDSGRRWRGAWRSSGRGYLQVNEPTGASVMPDTRSRLPAERARGREPVCRDRRRRGRTSIPTAIDVSSLIGTEPLAADRSPRSRRRAGCSRLPVRPAAERINWAGTAGRRAGGTPPVPNRAEALWRGTYCDRDVQRRPAHRTSAWRSAGVRGGRR